MPETRSDEQEHLDIEVAIRLMGFRWMEWSKAGLGEAPLYSPGRFLASLDDMTSHLYAEAAPDTPLADQPLARVPRYSQDEAPAFSAAEASGLFLDARATLSRDPDGSWVIELQGDRLASHSLPELLCRASLRWSSVRVGP
jgi:hypothetical protein